MQKLLIVGGGLSGLYLASLLEGSFEVTILEARERLGGRVLSIEGHDMGPSWVWPHHTAMLSIIESFGLELFRQYTSGNALYDTKERVEQFQTPPSAPSFRLKGSLTTLIDAIKEQLTNTKILFNEEALAIREDSNGVCVTTKEDEYRVDFVISTLAPRLAARLQYEPPLLDSLKSKMLTTQTWMGNSAKCVIEFKKAFWREESLSGFVFSHVGPLGEIHDASTQERAALFGFVSANATMESFEEDLKKQMYRLFGVQRCEIVNIYLVNWKQEKFSATKEDAMPLSAHPSYGIDTSSYSQRVLFSSTEFSFEEGGYLEGALRNAKRVASKLL